MYPNIIKEFEEWLQRYWTLERSSIYKNKSIFDIANKQDQSQAIIYYIAGMTDNFAIDTYKNIIGF